MKSFLTNNDVPVGYKPPSFPSLYWPIGENVSLHVIYYVSDIWKFTLYWSLIFNFGFYAIAGLWASISHKKQAGGLWILVLYCTYGGVQGVASGTITGFLIGSIYLAGLFSMSTWIPFCCAVVQILYDFTVSFIGSASIM